MALDASSSGDPGQPVLPIIDSLTPVGRHAATPGGTPMLVVLVRLIAAIATLIGLVETVTGLVSSEPRAVGLGAAAILYGVWVASRSGSLGGADREVVITRIAIATLALIAAAAVLQPSVAAALTIASLLPAVVVTPIVPSRTVLRLLIAGGIVGAWSEVAGRLVPTSTLPPGVQTAISLFTLVFAYTFLIMFLWEVSRQLKETASDLESVVRMSGDLAETLDPRLVGDRIAVHIAQAVGADDCALSYWDQALDRVVTLGYHPPTRREALSETYRSTNSRRPDWS